VAEEARRAQRRRLAAGTKVTRPTPPRCPRSEDRRLG
jgi:hypothetical protein